jgi:hypothetical protein
MGNPPLVLARTNLRLAPVLQSVTGERMYATTGNCHGEVTGVKRNGVCFDGTGWCQRLLMTGARSWTDQPAGTSLQAILFRTKE